MIKKLKVFWSLMKNQMYSLWDVKVMQMLHYIISFYLKV